MLAEIVDGQVATTYQHGAGGELLSQTKHDPGGTTEDSFYGYNPHGDVAGITDEAGNTRATYGYTAYGSDDESLFTGVDKPDPGDPTSQEPYNVYRYAGQRFDQASGTYDMGFRDYDPGLNRFLTRDSFNGALADMSLTTSPWTMSRYTFAGGNPTTLVEHDGHAPTCTPDGANLCPGYDIADQPQTQAPTELPMLPDRTIAPLNDQEGHPEYDSAPWWKKVLLGEEMTQQYLLAQGFKEYFCNNGPTACEQWGHWLGASGEDLHIDPSILMDEDNFANDVEAILAQYKEMAKEACHSAGAAVCEYSFFSGWDPTLDTTVDPVKVDFAGMGQVQLSLSGSITVRTSSDGRADFEGSYYISIFKAWNFDKGEYPEPYGVTIPHAFYELPAYGYVRDYVLRGTSGRRSL